MFKAQATVLNLNDVFFDATPFQQLAFSSTCLFVNLKNEGGGWHSNGENDLSMAPVSKNIIFYFYKYIIFINRQIYFLSSNVPGKSNYLTIVVYRGIMAAQNGTSQ
jgi:hypothetical protein